MLTPTRVASSLLANRPYVPPSWFEDYEQLAQLSGGIQIYLDRNYYYDAAKAAALEPHNASSTWPGTLLKSNPALTVVTMWVGVLGLALLSRNEYSEGTKDNQGHRFRTFEIGKQFVDSSGAQIWPNNAFFDDRVSEKGGNLATHNNREQTSPTIEDIQQFIVETFSLGGLGDLAKLCPVSRQTLYAWRKPNARPDKSSIRRFYVLWDMANNWKTAGFPAPSAHLRKPILKNRSLYDYLSDKDIDIDAIKFIGHRLLVTSMR